MGEAICLVLDVGASASQKPERGVSFLDAALGKLFFVSSFLYFFIQNIIQSLNIKFFFCIQKTF